MPGAANKARTDNGATPLYIASQNGHTNVVEVLGAEADEQRRRLSNPVVHCFRNGSPRWSRCCLMPGQTRTRRGAGGATPLYAARKGRTEVVEMLLGAGADANRRDERWHDPAVHCFS